MTLSLDPSMPQCVFLQHHHAERCLIALIIEDLFQDAIDANACCLATKHSSDALEAAMMTTNVADPDSCALTNGSLCSVNAGKQLEGGVF